MYQNISQNVSFPKESPTEDGSFLFLSDVALTENACVFILSLCVRWQNDKAKDALTRGVNSEAVCWCL